MKLKNFLTVVAASFLCSTSFLVVNSMELNEKEVVEKFNDFHAKSYDFNEHIISLIANHRKYSFAKCSNGDLEKNEAFKKINEMNIKLFEQFSKKIKPYEEVQPENVLEAIVYYLVWSEVNESCFDQFLKINKKISYNASFTKYLVLFKESFDGIVNKNFKFAGPNGLKVKIKQIAEGKMNLIREIRKSGPVSDEYFKNIKILEDFVVKKFDEILKSKIDVKDKKLGISKKQITKLEQIAEKARDNCIARYFEVEQKIMKKLV